MKVIVFDTETTGLIPSYNVSLYDTKKYPYIVQLSWLLFDVDNNKLVNVGDHIIMLPHGQTISDEASKIHGITNEMMRSKGVPARHALQEFANDLKQANVCVAHNIKFDKRMVRVEFIRNKMIDYIHKGNQSMYCTMYNSVDVCKIPRTSKLQEARIMLEKCLQQIEIRDNAVRMIGGRIGKTDPLSGQPMDVSNDGQYKPLNELGLVEMINEMKGKETVQYKTPKLIELHKYFYNCEPNNLHNSLVDVFVCFRCYYQLKYKKDIITSYDELNNYFNELCGM
jgi:DNA polymerase III epsilon subunit-like protein